MIACTLLAFGLLSNSAAAATYNSSPGTVTASNNTSAERLNGPDCPEYTIQISRSGTDVHVVGVSLYTISSDHMLLWPADDSGQSYGAWNGSPYGGANFTFDSGTISPSYVSVSVTNSANTLTHCRHTEYV